MQKRLDAYLILLHILLAPLLSFTPLYFSTHFHLLFLFLFICFLYNFSHFLFSPSFFFSLSLSILPFFSLPHSSNPDFHFHPILTNFPLLSSWLLVTFFSSLLLLTFHSFLTPLIISPPLVLLLLHRFPPVLSLSHVFPLLARP